MKAWTITVGCALMAACAGITSPGGGVHLDVGEPQTTNTAHQASVTRTLQSSVEITGRITTGDPCYFLRGASSLASGVLTVEIIASPRSDRFCAQVIAAFPYRAIASGLPSGPLRVVVIHRYENTGWPTTQVLDTTVVASR